MSDVTQIGLGAMGSALAGALLKAGKRVTVWNRSAGKADPLVALGAAAPARLADAVAASPVIMVCIDSYGATRHLLGQKDVVAKLSGRTLVQLSTGTPKEARDSEAWLKACGADTLDVAIDCYPDGIGAAKSRLLIAGSKTVFERCEPTLNCFAGDLCYLGENIAAAATLDLAELSHSLGQYLGFAHGAAICAAEGVGADLYAALFPEGDRARQLGEIVHAGAYELGSLHDGATVRVWEGVVQRLQTHAGDSGMDASFPDALSDIYARAIAAGYGEEDIAALMKVLRKLA